MAKKKTVKEQEHHVQFVTVLGRKIKVLNTKPDPDAFGHYDHRSDTIRIDGDLEPHTYRRILTHEMMHAALALSGIASYHITDSAEESICVLAESFVEDMFRALEKSK